MIFAGLVGAILWNLVTWMLGLPSSSSHALFGGLIGAVLIGAGVSGLNFSVVMSKIVLPAVVAHVVAGLAAGAATFILYVMIKRADKEPQAGWFRHAQSVSASMVALAHGTSDGQKTMGVITLVLITAGYQESGTGPQVWVIATAGLAIGLGTYSGGWRIMRTMGKGIVDARPAGLRRGNHLRRSHSRFLPHGFRVVHHPGLLRASIGSGVGKKLAHVRWTTARKILYGWLLTLSAAALVGGVAAAIALTGTIGLVIVFAALLAGAGAIYAVSKRAPVSSDNVNDSPDVTINPEKTPRLGLTARPLSP